MKKPTLAQLKKRPSMWIIWLELFNCYQVRILYPDDSCECLDLGIENSTWNDSVYTAKNLKEHDAMIFLGWL